MNEIDGKDDSTLSELDRQLDSMLEKAVPVRARVAKNPSTVFSIRMSSGEIDEFNREAAKRGMNLSEFMRSSTRAAILGQLDVEMAVVVGDVRQKLRELDEAVSRL